MTDQLPPQRIPNLPSSFYHIPNFISPEEEAAILAKINSSPARWNQLSHRRLQVYPTRLTNSNVLIAQPLPAWLSNPILPRFHELGIFTEDEPEDQAPDAGEENVDDVAKRQHALSASGTPHKAPNHILINEYPPGQGIMPHEDGDAYAPVVATVTLGGHCVLDLYAKDTDPENEVAAGHDLRATRKSQHRILQEPRSLLVTRGPAYREFLHGIADVCVDGELGPETISNWGLLAEPELYADGERGRELRISLTFRDVIKVSNVGSRLFRMGK